MVDPTRAVRTVRNGGLDPSASSEQPSGHRRSRRRFLQAVGVGSVGLVAGCLGGEDEGEFPSQSFRYIIPYGPGGGMDVWGRGLFPIVADVLDVGVEFENVTGAGGTRGFGECFRSDPDGYTLTSGSLGLVDLAHLIHEPDHDILEMETGGIYSEALQFMIYTNPDVGIQGWEDLLDRYRNGDLEVFGAGDEGGAMTAIAMIANDRGDLQYDRLVQYDGSGPLAEAVVAGEVPAGIATDSAVAGTGFLGQLELLGAVADRPSLLFDPEDHIDPETLSLGQAGYEPFDLLGIIRAGYYYPPDTPDDRVQTVFDAMVDAQETDAFAQWEEDSGNVGGPISDPDEHREMLEGNVQTLREEIDIDALRG